MTIDLNSLIRTIPDYPKPGIQFKDITPVLKNHRAMKQACEQLAERFKDDGVQVIAAPEARGFIFGVPQAMHMECSFVPIRKPGKLPYETNSVTYDLEYGTDTVEIHTDAINPGDKVLLVDDLLATGGTMSACTQLVEKLGGTVVGCAFLIELGFLNGRELLKDYRVEALIQE